MELDGVFTLIKRRVYDSPHLPDKSKQIVRFILIKTYKELSKTIQKESISESNQECRPTEMPNFLKDIFKFK